MTGISKETISLLNELSCETVAEKLGIEVCRHKALCFMHDDHHPSLSFWGSKREHWYCFVCGKGGKAVDLVKEATGLSFVEACEWICHEFGFVQIPNTVKVKRLRVKVRKLSMHDAMKRPFDTEVAQWILNNTKLQSKGQDFLFEQRKLNPSIIQNLNIKSIENRGELIKSLVNVFGSKRLENSGFTTNTNGKVYLKFCIPCLLFPFYDKENKLVGLQSRYLGDNKELPRFQFVSSQKTRMFNLPILNKMKKGDELYISEGITDCIALLSSGRNAVAIPSATILPQFDLKELGGYKLRMYPDQDDAGQKAFHALQIFFMNMYTNIHAIELPAKIKDFSEYYISTLIPKQ